MAQSKTADFLGDWKTSVPCGLEKDESDTCVASPCVCRAIHHHHHHLTRRWRIRTLATRSTPAKSPSHLRTAARPKAEGVGQSLPSLSFFFDMHAHPCNGRARRYQPDALVVMATPYEDTGIYLGFANMLNVTTPSAARAAGTTEVELAWSHDLLHWNYVA